jgi:lipopolysaccharide transport system permease protein
MLKESTHQFLNSLRQNFELVVSMTKSTMKSRYRKTFAGFFWVILNPILTFSVQSVIFSNILKFKMDNYFLFLLSGIIPWIFLTSTILMTVSIFVVNRPVLMAFKLDPRIFVFAQTIDNFITFIASFIILLVLNWNFEVVSFAKILMLILSLSLICGAAFFASCLMATLHVFMRDTQFIVQFVLSLAYFITPIFYPKELIPEQYQWAITYNPFYIIIKPFQSIFWKYDFSLYLDDTLKALLLLVTLMITSTVYWEKNKDALFFKL